MPGSAGISHGRGTPGWPAVTHVGPDPETLGGMQTVVRTYVDMCAPLTTVQPMPTWRPGGSAAGLFLTLAAALRLARPYAALRLEGIRAALRLTDPAVAPRPGRRLAHVHLSHRGSFVREGALAALAKLLGYRVVVTVHGCDFVTTGGTLPWRPVYRAVLRHCDRIAVLDRDALSTARRLAPAVPATVMPNPGPLPDDWAPATSAGAAEPIVLFAGELTRRKGVDVLLRAWDALSADVPDARMLIAGPPGDVVVEPRPNVTVLGPVPPDRVRELLGRARVAVLPSTAEGMPMFVLEAMAAGRPVVGTAVGAMGEMLGGAGRTIPRGDAAALAAALRCYLLDGALAERDGATGRARYVRLHARAAALPRLSRFYGIPDPQARS